MKKNIFIDIRNKNKDNFVEYRADPELSNKIVNDIVSEKSFQALMEALSDK